MTSKRRDIYSTLKKSISSPFSTVGDVFGQGSSSGVKYRGGSGTTWIHPPDVLLNGRVEYSVKLLGCREVDKPKGTDTIRDAITAINFNLQVKRSETGHSGAKLQKVDLQVNVEGITISDSKSKMILHRYPLQRISFCADDKKDKRVFSFIAKADKQSERHDCFVFLSDKLAEQITLTVGEAFDLAYKRYMDKNKTSLENEKQVLFLRKRIAELEAENQVLSERLAEAVRGQTKPADASASGGSLLDAPALPSSPMPRGPPPGIQAANEQSMPSLYSIPHQDHLSKEGPSLSAPNLLPRPASQVTTDSSLAPNGANGAPVFTCSPIPAHAPPPLPSSSGILAPPPPVAPRRNAPSKKGPEVGRKLENLQLDKMEDLFDNDFDPRATSEKKADYDPFGDDFLDDALSTGVLAGSSTAARLDSGEKQTADDIQKMIDSVDMRLAEMCSGFRGGELDTGKVSPTDSIQDPEENEYGTPNGRVNQQVVGTSKKDHKAS